MLIITFPNTLIFINQFFKIIAFRRDEIDQSQAKQLTMIDKNIVKVIKRFLRQIGIEISRYNPDTNNSALLKKYLDLYSISDVIDVGANIGQFGVLLREAGYKNKIISFEPLKDSYVTLQKRCAKYKKWDCFPYGVGSEKGKLKINVSRNKVSSSILEVTSLSTVADEQTTFESSSTIEIITLDEFLKDKLNSEKSIYLKIDVQGFELEVLKGSLELLKNIKIIQLEMSFVALYKNGPLYKEIVSWMENQNFELYTIIPDFRDVDSGRMLQADGVFVNKRFSI